MSDLKIRILIDNINIELEGESGSVTKIFDSLKQDGLGAINSCLSDKNSIELNNKIKIENQIEKSNLISEEVIENEELVNNELPSLNNLVLSGGPSKESEWIVIYAYYCSNQGKNTFTKEDLRQSYRDTNRFTDTRSKNFSSNFKSIISSKLLAAINTEDFRIEKKGIELAESIIWEKGDTKSQPRKNRKKAPEICELVELNLSADERKNFELYYRKHNNRVNMDKIVLIAAWLKDNKSVLEIDKDIIFTMLRSIGEEVDFKIQMTMQNAKNKNYLVAGASTGKFKIHHIGEDHITRDLESNE